MVYRGGKLIMIKTYTTILKNELKLSFRGIDMFIFAICMPLVVISLIGMFWGNRPAFEGANYSFFEQSFSAVCTIAISAGGLMGLPLVISDYRSRKILKRFKVTPISPVMILIVQLTIYALYALASLVFVYFIAAVFFNFRLTGSFVKFFLSYILVMYSMFSIGLMVGGIAKDVKSAGSIASVLYFPMIIFSGSTIPYEIMPSLLQKFANILPLSHGIKLLKCTSLGLPVGNVVFPIALMIGISVICSGIAIKFFKWE